MMKRNHIWPREVRFEAGSPSCFLFGPRLTGKTFLLRKLNPARYFDLLDPEIELRYRANPKLFWEELQATPSESLIIVDEVQRVPPLLDYVQMTMESLGHRFILSGSSARKLRRGAANLLGGRAIDRRLHPLTTKELGKHFSIRKALEYGTLPKIASLLVEGKTADALAHLQSYATIYLKEEIQAEALTRKLAAFQRFFDVAAQANAQMIEYANISRECAVPMATVKEYYQILEDTLIGRFLWPYARSERKKARPKFYFFDCGVVRALQGRLTARPSPEELGSLFETWMINEFHRIRNYQSYEHRLSLWREGRHEVDLLVEQSGKPLLAIEFKSGNQVTNTPSLHAFRRKHPRTRLIVASLKDEKPRRLEEGIELRPFQEVLKIYRSM